VVAVEANPRLCRQARRRFRSEIEDGRLTLVEGAIAAAEGETDFLVFRSGTLERRDEWSALDNHYARRNVEEKQLRSKRIRVRAYTLDALLRRYGVPYYLKLDIEGGELPCVRALRGLADPPAFVSLEIDYLRDDIADESLTELLRCGYDRFKIVAQGQHAPAHGYVFEKTSSGPFGEETAGEWEDVESIRATYAAHLPELIWHDLHAAR
jgi:FkbM family methyltransferase